MLTAKFEVCSELPAPFLLSSLDAAEQETWKRFWQHIGTLQTQSFSWMGTSSLQQGRRSRAEQLVDRFCWSLGCWKEAHKDEGGDEDGGGKVEAIDA